MKQTTSNRKAAHSDGQIKLTLNAWAVICGHDRRTLTAALTKADCRPARGEKIPLRTILRALLSDERLEKVRGLRLANEKLEREGQQAKRELVPWDVVEHTLMTRFVNPAITALDAAPEGVSREWIEKVFKPILRQSLEAPAA